VVVEEYTSIMKNDVWDIVPRPEGKSIVSSKWLYKIKHATDGNIEKFKARLWTMRRHLLQLPGTLPLEQLCPWFHLWDGGYIKWM
jgi:hypothetical protein